MTFYVHVGGLHDFQLVPRHEIRASPNDIGKDEESSSVVIFLQ